ncbi:MAG: hypothetical protein N2322_06110 [Terrimicrobiaceae bacterium]|nr:hypothetical protein [Terrimicrobiaceae bacterium]
MLPRLLPPALLLAFAAASPAQNPPEQIDLSQFPAASVDDVVVPVPSEIFIVLDKLGSPNWRAELSGERGVNTGNRAQVALLLGTVIADGFIAVQAQDSQRVEEIGQQVLTLSDAIGVRKAVLARSKSITEKASAKDWPGVRREFDGALKDVRGAMEELGDHELAQLVSAGGWIRGTQVLTSVISKNYSADGAELLNQPQLLDYFTRQLDNLTNARLKRDPLVGSVRKLLRDLKPLVQRAASGPLPADQVQKIQKLTAEITTAIRKGEG